MLPGDYEHSADVRELTTYAVVNGVLREIESVSLDAELTGDLPEQVTGMGGVAGSTGTIVWAVQNDAVEPRGVSPWHKPVGWPPSSGDRIRIYATDGVTSYPRFTGRIDRTTGVVGGRLQSTVIDDRDQLNTLFTHPAILRHHVPLNQGEAYRSVGLNHWYALTAALRQAGIYNVPGMDAPTALSAPLQGSVWPEAGNISTAIGVTSGNHAQFYRAPWGYAAGSFDVRYLPRLNYTARNQVMVSLTVAENSAGVAYADVMYGTDRIRLLVDPDRTIKAYWGSTLVCQLPASRMEGATRVSLLVRNGAWALRNDNGQEATGSHATSSETMSLVRFNANPNARVAGLLVDHPNTAVRDRNYTHFTPSMQFDPGNLASTMDAMPRVESENVARLVDKICQATLTSAWWDETGVLRLASADRLRGADPVQTVTTLDDITALSWEDSLLSVRSRVNVKWQRPIISKGRTWRKELFRGRGDTLDEDDENEVFAVPADDVDWLGVHRNPTRLTDANWGSYNRKRGSFMGVYYTNSNDDELSTSAYTTTITTEPIGTVGLKIRHIGGSYAAGVEANLGTSETSTALRESLRGEALPVIRGMGEVSWEDTTYTSPTVGPGHAPELTHDLGRWGHDYFSGESVAERLGNWIAIQVTSPSPMIRSLDVMYDPRRQIGDVITAELGILDVTLRLLVVGINENHQAGDHEQSLTVRIINATSTRKVTYAELEKAWAGGTYTQLETVWAGLTYNDFMNNPLEGSPNG